MTRARHDIDPARIDVCQDGKPPKRKRRKDRTKPDPSPHLKAGEPAALGRALKRPLSPGIMLEPRKDGEGWQMVAPHSDGNLWELQLADAFGTRSHSVMQAFLRDLRKLCSMDWDDDAGMWKADEMELNSALAMVNDIRPQNTAEAALAAQMVAVHWMQMRLSRDALNKGGMVLQSSAALASKLARTYAMQLDQLRLMRGGKKPTARQSIKVTKIVRQEVHYHDNRGFRENEGQSQETVYECIREPEQPAGTGEPEERPALPSPEETGSRVVPFPGDARKERVPDARRKGGRTKR